VGSKTDAQQKRGLSGEEEPPKCPTPAGSPSERENGSPERLARDDVLEPVNTGSAHQTRRVRGREAPAGAPSILQGPQPCDFVAVGGRGKGREEVSYISNAQGGAMDGGGPQREPAKKLRREVGR
jgi:hypothetical protein